MADKTIVVRLRAATGQYQAQMRAAAAETRGFSTSIAASAKSASSSATAVTRVASMAGKALLLGLGAGLAISAKAAIDFESSFAGIRKTVDASEAQFSRLSDTMRGLAKEIPINVNELNRIGELGGQLGIGVNALEDFTEVVAKLGVTTTLSTEAAGFALARLANVLGVGSENFENMGSAIVELGNNFATTEDEIVTFAQRIAPVGSVVGLTVDQVLAIAAAFASVGIPAERGGTAVQKVFSAMSEAAVEGGDDLETFAKIAGVSIATFVELMEEDAAQAFDFFLQGLKDVQEQGGNVFAVLDSLGLGSERTVNSVLALANAEGLLTRALSESSDAFDANTALVEEAEKRFNTTASRISLARNAINDLRIDIGTGLLPEIGDFAEGVADLINWIQKWDDGTKRMTGRVLTFAAGVSFASLAVGFLSKKIKIDLVGAVSAAIVPVGSLGIALRTVVRLGFAGVILGMTSALFDFIGKQVEARKRTDELVEALIEERKGLEGVVDATLTKQIFDILGIEGVAAMNAFGISIEDVVADLREGSDVLEGRLKPVLDSLVFRDNEIGPFNITFGENAELWETVQALDDLVGIFQEAKAFELEIFSNEQIARARETEIFLLKNRSAIFRLRSETRGLSRDQVDLGDAFALTADEADELTQAIDDLHDAELGARDTAFAYIDAVLDMAEAQDEFRKTANIDTALELQRAWLRLIDAAKQLGAEGLAPAIRNLEEMAAAGSITADEFLILTSMIAAFGPLASEGTRMAAQNAAANLSTIDFSAKFTQEQIEDLIGTIFGLGDAMMGSLNQMGRYGVAVDQVARAITRLRAAGEYGLIAGILAPSTTRAFSNVSTIFSNLSKGLAESLGRGFRSAAGSLSGAVESELTKALGVARSGISLITSAIRGGFNFGAAVDSLTEAEERLAELRTEQAGLPDVILAKEKELADARVAATAITLEEQQAIEETEEAYKRAQAAFAQGLITENTLAIFEEERNQALENAVGTTDEVIQLEEELEDLRQREIDIITDLERAQISLFEAQLNLIDAQEALISRGAEFVQKTPAQVAAFRSIALAAGLTSAEIDNLINNLTGLASLAFAESPFAGLSTDVPTGGGGGFGGGFGGGGGGDIPTIEIFDPVAAFAAMLAALPGPGELTPEQLAAIAALTPGLNGFGFGGFGFSGLGGIQEFHKSGVVGGISGRETIVRALPGEVIFNPNIGQTLGNTVTINELIVQGIWDLTKPDQVKRMVDGLENELSIRGIKRGSAL